MADRIPASSGHSTGSRSRSSAAGRLPTSPSSSQRQGLIDPLSMELLRQQQPQLQAPACPPRSGANQSVDLTDLASMVGSTVEPSPNAYLKSITFFQDPDDEDDLQEWGLVLSTDPPPALDAATFAKQQKEQERRGWLRSLFSPPKHRLYIHSVEGILHHSKIRPGDHLKTIHGKPIHPRLSAIQAIENIQMELEETGVFCISTKNSQYHADNVLIQATIIKPSFAKTISYQELGILVWHWGHLCIKEIVPDSIGSYTILKEEDQVIAVNDISCEGLSPQDFVNIIRRLMPTTLEVTITVVRRKERLNGKFG